MTPASWQAYARMLTSSPHRLHTAFSSPLAEHFLTFPAPRVGHPSPLVHVRGRREPLQSHYDNRRKKMLNASGGSTHPCRTMADIEPSREVSIIQLYASPHTIVEHADNLDIGGATPKRASTSHSSIQLTKWYDLARSMKQIYLW